MGIWDTLMQQVEEADREIFKKYPKMAEQINRQDEFVSSWEDWRNKYWDNDAKMTKNAVEAIRQRDEEIEALRLTQGGDMNWDDIKANVIQTVEQSSRAKGLISKEDFDRGVAAAMDKFTMKIGDKPVPVTEYVQNVERGMEWTYAKSAHLPLKYFTEFGEVKSMEDFMKYMRENGIMKYEDAYEAMARPLREAKAKESLEKEKEQIRKQTREETLKEMTMKQGALPVDDRGSSAEMSGLQLRINSRKKIENPEGVPKLTPGELGSMASAQDAYQAYLKDQSNGTKPKVQ